MFEGQAGASSGLAKAKLLKYKILKENKEEMKE